MLDVLATGATNRAIAERLCITEKTASVRVSNLISKLGVTNRGAAAALARELANQGPTRAAFPRIHEPAPGEPRAVPNMHPWRCPCPSPPTVFALARETDAPAGGRRWPSGPGASAAGRGTTAAASPLISVPLGPLGRRPGGATASLPPHEPAADPAAT